MSARVHTRRALSAPHAADRAGGRGRCADRPACAGRRQIALLQPPPDLHGGAAAGVAKPAKAPWVLTPVTQRDANHYNPFLAPGGRHVGYHRCRSHGSVPTLARHDSPVPGAGRPRCAAAVRVQPLLPLCRGPAMCPARTRVPPFAARACLHGRRRAPPGAEPAAAPSRRSIAPHMHRARAAHALVAARPPAAAPPVRRVPLSIPPPNLNLS